MRRILLSSLGFILVFVLSTATTLAYHQQQVLGETATLNTPTIPATSEGPGLILPDSPLFFLDELKQAIRTALALTPETKAKIHMSIAGERMAELRLMLVKKDRRGIDRTLAGVSENLVQAARDIGDAQLTGRDISKLAREINESIKTKQRVLDDLGDQAEKDLRTKVRATTASLLPAKVKVEDALPTHEIESEIRDDLKRQVERRVKEASSSAQEIEDEIAALQKEASESSQKSLKRREEAIKRALEQKNETLKRVLEGELELEKRKRDELVRTQERAVLEARRAAEAAKNAAAELEKADQIRNQPVSGN